MIKIKRRKNILISIYLMLLIFHSKIYVKIAYAYSNTFVSNHFLYK